MSIIFPTLISLWWLFPSPVPEHLGQYFTLCIHSALKCTHGSPTKTNPWPMCSWVGPPASSQAPGGGGGRGAGATRLPPTEKPSQPKHPPHLGNIKLLLGLLQGWAFIAALASVREHHAVAIQLLWRFTWICLKSELSLVLAWSRSNASRLARRELSDSQ